LKEAFKKTEIYRKYSKLSPEKQQTKNGDHQNNIKPRSPKEESNDIIPMAVKINPQKNL
jgi:hypothetical protein